MIEFLSILSVGGAVVAVAIPIARLRWLKRNPTKYWLGAGLFLIGFAIVPLMILLAQLGPTYITIAFYAAYGCRIAGAVLLTWTVITNVRRDQADKSSSE